MKQLYKEFKFQSVFVLVLSLVFISFSCMQKKEAAKNPPGYDLSKPQKFVMPASLTEISGHTFYKGDAAVVYAQEDESGKVYFFKPGAKDVASTQFAGPGDYEDIAICREQVIMLRSDGVLFIFPLAQVKAGKVTSVKTINNILPKGEYEGMYADEKTGTIYIITKNSKADKKMNITAGYKFNLLAGNNVKQAGEFSISTGEIAAISGEKKKKKKEKFMPSALTRNPLTNEWYILSSINKMIVVADSNWKVKDVYPLNRSLFPQPEGIAFDRQGNLYISNEGGKGSGTLLKYVYNR
ncbi:SdiA-regulated domain-containing protein [Mucilaginibacter sp. UR6-1]|uniref:SdiA-regulated domain-containing protein n=1 Tax=Mucilaginibacter sp. UR6-1 TaxID=1435643 RepID=UPI001E5C965A|nr:SdiA-regulated domain-containing protein [Mucilaginibacter sp. UR6-1]MCC8409036.1 SdiA-regulated domain-containing protein [Mucilaginibacter sp. UR6-1]